mmetsp:Transcript_65799/g.157233  ORF Transcript_65799/g.157233 Transcript_65799/m.157233 type:complete len:573 (-) Transcript_65799:88-1806(-)
MRAGGSDGSEGAQVRFHESVTLSSCADSASTLGTDNSRRSFNALSFVPERGPEAHISSRYDIDQREIAAGGYGKVFIAKDRMFQDRQVAIKKLIKNDQRKEQFKREVAIMKELDHPHICKLLETYDTKRFVFFVMEFCEGGEVFERIMESGQIAETVTADIIRQVAGALKYAHHKGIAHRDLKPENICFCSRDTACNDVKVIDWGLGFYFGTGRMVSAVGSLTYAAPEVLEANEYDAYTSACDVWSLGVLTYVMLCGKPPFWGSHKEQMKKMRKEEYPMSQPPWNVISGHAKDFISSLLKRNPKKRLSVDAIVSHPWFTICHPTHTDGKLVKEVMQNMKQFSRTSQFFSICVASVARQLDHRSLQELHKVFQELDTNADGVLELHEVKSGFEKIFGRDSPQVQEVEDMFLRLDLDGSGTLDYTEFCAAAIGEHLSTQDHVLWAAFKTFDIQDDDGTITKQEIEQVLRNGDVNKMWSADVCQRVAAEVVAQCDANQDGSIDFNEWVKLMRDASLQQSEVIELACDVQPGQESSVPARRARYLALQESSAGSRGRQEHSCCACLPVMNGKCTIM